MQFSGGFLFYFIILNRPFVNVIFHTPHLIFYYPVNEWQQYTKPSRIIFTGIKNNTYAEVGENCKVGEFVSSILAGTKHFAWLNIPIVWRADLQILKFPIICATFEEIIETMATQNIDKL